MIGGAAIIIFDLGLDFGLTESVGNVQGLKTGNVVLEQGFTVVPRREQARGLNPQALPQHLPGEIFISSNLNAFELVHRAGIDLVDHADQVRTAFLLETDGGVEVTASLEIVQKVALAFVEQA